MSVATVTIELDEKAAEVYTEASLEQRQKIQMLIGMLLRHFESSPQSLLALMSEISDNAQKRGLTPEILEQILSEE